MQIHVYDGYADVEEDGGTVHVFTADTFEVCDHRHSNEASGGC